MNGSRILLVCLLASLLFFGCTTPATPPENVTPNVTTNETNVTPPIPPPPPPPPPINQTNLTACNWTNPLPDSAEEGLLRYSTGSTVEAVSVSDYGYRAVAGGTDHKIYYFKRGSAQPFYAYETGDQANSVSMSENGFSYVAGSWDGKVYYFECDRNQPAWAYDAKKDNENATIRSVDITKDGNSMAAVTWTTLYIFNKAGNGAPSFKINLNVPDYKVETVAISDDGSKVAVGTANNGLNSKVFMFNASTGQKVWENSIVDMRWADNVPVPVAISGDGSVVAAGGPDNKIRLWKGAASEPIWKYEIAPESFVYSVALSYDGKRLAATGDYRLFYFEDTSIGTPTWVNDGTWTDQVDESRDGYYGIGNRLHAVGLSMDGYSIAAADSVMGHLFTFRDGQNESMIMHDLEYDVDGVQSVAISPDSSYVIAGSSSYGEILRFKAG